MHRPQLITWKTHTEESTTLLEATRPQEALLYTALHYTYMCNIVTELYSIVYIYLIKSRLDVTTSVRHHFCTATLSWCQRVVRFSRDRRENLTVIELTRNNNNNNNASKFREEFTVIELTHNNKFKEEFTHTQHFKRLFERTL